VLASLGSGSVPDELLNEIVEAYQSQVLAFFLQRGLSRELAEEATQEVFVKVIRALPSFRGQAALKTWIYQIAVNLFRDLLRQRQRCDEIAWSDAFAGGRAADPPEVERSLSASTADDPEESAARQQLREAVQQAVTRLPSQQRVAMSLHLQDYPAREIAAVMGKRVVSVRMLLSRARRNLRQPLQDLAKQPGDQGVGYG
jgi:RNA polymerase sigma-70 factor (ECF subfamily)